MAVEDNYVNLISAMVCNMPEMTYIQDTCCCLYGRFMQRKVWVFISGNFMDCAYRSYGPYSRELRGVWLCERTVLSENTYTSETTYKVVAAWQMLDVEFNILYSNFCLNNTYAVYESFPNFPKESIAVSVIIYYKHIVSEISTNIMNNFYNFF